MKTKPYQINYEVNGKIRSEIIEAVSRKAARTYMAYLGLKHIHKKHKKYDTNY
jgi:hypothetical protein